MSVGKGMQTVIVFAWNLVLNEEKKYCKCQMSLKGYELKG